MSDSKAGPDKGNSELSPLKRAFLALEAAQTRVAQLERAANEPIAVVGIGCRVPGGDDPAGFWELLQGGEDMVSPTPSARWDADALYDPNPEVSGRIAARNAGYLRGPVDEFDAEFFGIAPREAVGMDPQQRLLLEVSWEALENAAQPPDQLERSRTGVYFGLCASDYANLQLKCDDPKLLDAHFTSGIAHSVASGRLSYLLGLQGPALTIDSACSSSLVAVHLACQALRTNDCSMALAGGVNLLLAPELYMALSRARMLSPEGRCKTFDEAADGFARGEGCGVVVLKRLSDAQAAGDRIHALILGSAVNQDGPSGSLTAPNGPAQEAVIREALSRAGLSPHQVSCIEAHGTGTTLGDPLEVGALGAVFGQGRPGGQPLWLASVKTNIGHLEGAAGVVGFIKLVLSLKHRQIPRHLHFRRPSSHIAWEELPFKVPTSLTEWEPIDGRRIAGVSSFGFSGTNAHVILEEAPKRDEALPSVVESSGDEPWWLLALSARTQQALLHQAVRYNQALAECSDRDLADVCHTANAGRAHLSHRATVLAQTMAQLRDGLSTISEGRTAEGALLHRAVPRDPPRVAFLFTGQGAQYAGMGKRLYEQEPIFRAALDRCSTALEPHLDKPLLELLFSSVGTPALLNQTVYTQPALFAIEFALSELWRSWGVEPHVVIGHSVGEYVAACVAGVFSLEDGLRLIAARARLMQALPAGGGMAAVFAPEQRVLQAIGHSRSQRVSIAAVNGPEQTVISGSLGDVDLICSELGEEGVRCRRLAVSHAFHSPLMDPCLDAFEREAGAVAFSKPRIPLISNVTGEVADPTLLTSPAYFRRHVREAVKFGAGLDALLRLGPGVAVEIGPHPTLLAFAKAVYGDTGPRLVACLRQNRPDDAQMLHAAAALYGAGVTLDFKRMSRGERRIMDLPTYPFERQRYWFRTSSVARRASGAQAHQHPLLGSTLDSAAAETIYEASVSADEPSFVRQHCVQGHVILPATAYLEMLRAAAVQLFRNDSVSVQQTVVQQPLILDAEGAARSVQTVCAPEVEGVVRVALSSRGEEASGGWLEHVTASLVRASGPLSDAPTMAQARTRCPEAQSPEELYAGFERRGLEFGNAFRTVKQLWRGDQEAFGLVELATDNQGEVPRYGMHPVLLDGCIQVLAAALPDGDGAPLYLPIGIGAYRLQRSPGVRCYSHVRVQSLSEQAGRADISVFDEQGKAIAELSAIQLKRASEGALQTLGRRWLDDCLFEVVWHAAADGPATSFDAPPLESLGIEGMRALDATRQMVALEAYEAFLPQLEALCAQYTVETMRRLGWSPVVDDVVEPGALARRLRVVDKHGQLFARLLGILAEDGYLAREGQGFRVVRALESVTPEQRAQQLLTTHPIGASELEMTMRTASRMAEALRGEADPMQLLFPAGSLENAERLYRDSPTARLYNGMIAEVLAAVAQAVPPERELRILEVGAGTGGTTSHVVPRLAQERVEYTFTDVGPLFVSRARERHSRFPFLSFEVFDLEGDPEEQGFPSGAYDVVIASNVVHATADVSVTLEKLRRLLTPGGLLVMLEVTAPQRWFDLTVGLTDGWWAFEDRHLRADYATLLRDQWFGVLSRCGFDATVALPEGAPLTGSLALQSLFIARAAPQNKAGASRNWLILSDQQGVGEELATRLRGNGHHCTLARYGSALRLEEGLAELDFSAPTHYRELMERLRSVERMPEEVVFLHGLDAPSWDGRSEADSAVAESVAVSGLLLVQALVSQAQAPHLTLVSRGAQPADGADSGLEPFQAMLWGLSTTIRREHPELECRCIDLDPRGAGVGDLYEELFSTSNEPSVALRAGRQVARLARASSAALGALKSVDPYRIVPATPGSLEEFTTVSLERRAPGPGEVEIEVEATGLNFKDVLNVLGMYPGNAGPLGGECAGKVVALGDDVSRFAIGDDVMAVAPGCFSSHVIARAELTQRRPASMGAEEAASLPIAFLTAAFCLSHLAKLGAGERVLIHAAAGGVGMAAVRLAQRAGAEVFATAGSEEKRALVRSLGVQHVFDSRSPAFAEQIQERTDGRGVDVVLNSLAGELIDASFRALARGGRFVEIGKRGIKSHEWVTAQARDHAYFIVDWGETAERDPQLIRDLFEGLVSQFIDGNLLPLPRHTFTRSEVGRAFRLMAQARHVGKIVVQHHAPTGVRVRRDGTYLITGGLSGLGLVVARWLVEQGAGRVVLMGRRALNAEVNALLDPLRGTPSVVDARSLDITDSAGLTAVLESVRASGPPIRGVFHSAGLLDDAVMLQQDATRFSRVYGPKVRGTLLLEMLTRTDPLDCFVLFSSVASVLGAPGQSNHSSANAFLDLLAHERRRRGLPALSINWGAWAEVGAAANRTITKRIESQGLGSFTPTQGLLVLEKLLAGSAAQVVALPADFGRFVEQTFAGKVPPLLSELAGREGAAAPSRETRAHQLLLSEQLAAAPRGRWRSLVAAFVRERALQALGMNADRALDPQTPLGDLGLDSLLAVELRNTLTAALGRPLPVTLLFDYPTLDALTGYLVGELTDGSGESPASAEQTPKELVGSIEELSDQEVERQLAALASKT